MAEHPRREGIKCLAGKKLRMQSNVGFILLEGHIFGKTR
jgi:hypothetical protein